MPVSPCSDRATGRRSRDEQTSKLPLRNIAYKHKENLPACLALVMLLGWRLEMTLFNRPKRVEWISNTTKISKKKLQALAEYSYSNSLYDVEKIS